MNTLLGTIETLIGLVILPVIAVVIIAGVLVSGRKSREDSHWTNRLAGGFMQAWRVSSRKIGR